jgi:hypothetical protein
MSLNYERKCKELPMDNLDSHIEIKLGIPEELKHQAAIICCEGFFSQIEWLFGSKQKAITVLEHSFDTELGLTAQMQGQLVGFVELKYKNRPFLQFERSNLDTFQNGLAQVLRLCEKN